jgi:hypothetical protein
VALTANVKVVVTGNYSMFLESIDSDPALSSAKLKKFRLGKDGYYDEAIPAFFADLPAELAFKVSNDEPSDLMYTDFDKQYDDLYNAGCRNIYNNKSYQEEFECFAPLHLGNSLPSHLIIFRLDGPGSLSLDRTNFMSEVVDKLKCVTLFNLTRNTPLGEWLNRNFVNNPSRPAAPLYLNFRQLEFSSWNGIDYEVGGYASKSVMLDPVLEYENTFYDLERFITDGYKNNKVVYPDILNLSFLFDDTPATPEGLRKWSLNRYLGLYADALDKVHAYSPYTMTPLRSDTVVRPGNILRSVQENPFEVEWDETKPTYVEYNGEFYKVERYFRDTSPSETRIRVGESAFSDEVVQGRKYFYKVLSDKDFTGLTSSAFNSRTVGISRDGSGFYIERVTGQDLIPDYDDADIWIAKILDKFHVVRKRSGRYYLNTDCGFELTDSQLRYWINEKDPTMTTRVDLDPLRPTVEISLYRVSMTQVRDFDTDIVDTGFARYEYEKDLSLTATDQPKIYSTDFSSAQIPRPKNEYYIDGRLTNVPCASEYTANGETFRVSDGTLSDLWSKNPMHLKWGFEGSVSAGDYPYRVNNSMLADNFNGTTNPMSILPSRGDMNLDHFYTVNSSSPTYSFHSLHVESFTANGQLDAEFKFDLRQYLSVDKDYFTWFFGKTASLGLGSKVVPTQKWSVFQKGDRSVPNTTLFRGIGFDIQDVAEVKVSSGRVDSINLSNKNNYEDWKFTILVSKNDAKVYASASDLSSGYIDQSDNNLSWYTIGDWQMSKRYEKGDLVTYQGILWKALTQSVVTDPRTNPSNSPQWYPNNDYTGILPLSQSIFWNPLRGYTANDWVYYGGDFYYYNPKGFTVSFWNPKKIYEYNDRVIYSGNVWQSTTASNFYQPGSSALRSDFAITDTPYYWNEIKYTEDFYSKYSDWNPVEMWSSNYLYGTNSVVKPGGAVSSLPGRPYALWDDVLWQLTGVTVSSDRPDTSPAWARVYSLAPDTGFIYNTQSNPIINMNNSYYVCTANPGLDTLENGICVYVHKKWKNVLVNIYINDNTLENLSNADRDSLYKSTYSNLTAQNVISAVNDMSRRWGFSDRLMYVVVEQDGKLSTYDYLNISSLPVMLTPRLPDEVYTRTNSLVTRPTGPSINQLNPRLTLESRRILTADMINYYNGNRFGVEISRTPIDPNPIAYYHGLKNVAYTMLYRFSGGYGPITYEVPLFARQLVGATASGNYKFDTSITDFGMVRQRVISKVNRRGSVLKLRSDATLKSIYPMVDEFGYTTRDLFVFKSSWDNDFYIECVNPGQDEDPVLITNKIIRFE